MANRNKAKKMAAAGATAKEIRKETGVKGQVARNIVSRASTPSPGPYNASNMPISTAAPTAGPLASGYVPLPDSPTPTRTTPEIKSLGQGLRIAGGGYGIGKSELDTLVGLGKDKAKISPDKLIRRLDKINAKLIEGDKTGISLKSGAANKLIRKTSKLNPLERSQLNFGTGRIGMQIQGMLGDPGSPGYMRQGQRVGARDAVGPTFLAKGDDIGPKGKIQNRGVGKQYEVPARLLGTEPAAGESMAGDGEASQTIGEEITTAESPIPEEETTAMTIPGAGDFDLTSWATGYRRAKSSRRKAGKGAQGLSSMKKSPFTSWYK